MSITLLIIDAWIGILSTYVCTCDVMIIFRPVSISDLESGNYFFVEILWLSVGECGFMLH